MIALVFLGLLHLDDFLLELSNNELILFLKAHYIWKGRHFERLRVTDLVFD